MKFVVRSEGQFNVIALKGEIDLHASPYARTQILEHLEAKRNVLVDLSGVEYIDSSGIASLVEGLRLAKSNNLQFGLVGVSDAAMQVIQLARLDKVFLIRPSSGDFGTEG